MALLTINGKTFDNWNFTETSPKLRATPSREFMAVDNSGNSVLVGGNEYYLEWDVTISTRVDGTGNVITTFAIPDIEIYSTSDAIGFTGAAYRFTFHDAFGNLLAVWDGFDRVALPAFNGNVAEWHEVYIYNHPASPILIDRETLSRTQIVALMGDSVSGVASFNGRDGIVTLSSGDVTDALGFTPVPNTRTVNGLALSANISLTKSDIGLGNVDNTSDADKPISTATQSALNAKQALNSDLTTIAGLTPANDDIIQRKAGVWANRTVTQFKSDLALTKSDVGLSNVDNTSDVDKPISSATQTALNAKQALDADLTAIAGLTPVDDDIIQRKAGAWVNRTMAQLKTDLALTKSDVGLSNVDNTSDANKPISTATQTALDAKQGLLTNSAGLRAALSDETGTGAAVFATSPTMSDITVTGVSLFGGEIRIGTQISLDGTTPRSWGSITNAVEASTSALAFGTSTDIHLASNLFFSSATSAWKYIGAQKGARLQAFQGDFAFYTAPTGSANADATETQRFFVSNLGNAVVGSLAALTTTATDGFLYIPTTAGTPTGVPTSYTGKSAMVFDTTNNILYLYDSGWIAGGGGGGGDMTLAGVQTVTGAKTFNPAKLIVGEQASAPAVVANSFWVDSDDGKLYFGKRDGSAWLEVFLSSLSGPVSVPNGGTGAATLTGILMGNGTSAFTAATAGTDYVSPIASVNAQTGTTYTVVAADNGKIITFNNAGAITVTVPSGLGAGFNCLLIQIGAGQVSLTASGTTINNRQSHTKLAGQHAAATLAAYVANTFNFSGDTSA